MVALTLWHRRALELPPIRPLLPIIAASLVYLVTLTASSAFAADDPGASLRLVAWTGLSMSGGLAAALLIAGRAARAISSFSGPAAVVATVGLVAGVVYLLFGLGDDPLVGGVGGPMPRVYVLTLEPNLYASLLAADIRWHSSAGARDPRSARSPSQLYCSWPSAWASLAVPTSGSRSV